MYAETMEERARDGEREGERSRVSVGHSHFGRWRGERGWRRSSDDSVFSLSLHSCPLSPLSFVLSSLILSLLVSSVNEGQRPLPFPSAWSEIFAKSPLDELH